MEARGPARVEDKCQQITRTDHVLHARSLLLAEIQVVFGVPRASFLPQIVRGQELGRV